MCETVRKKHSQLIYPQRIYSSQDFQYLWCVQDQVNLYYIPSHHLKHWCLRGKKIAKKIYHTSPGIEISIFGDGCWMVVSTIYFNDILLIQISNRTWSSRSLSNFLMQRSSPWKHLISLWIEQKLLLCFEKVQMLSNLWVRECDNHHMRLVELVFPYKSMRSKTYLCLPLSNPLTQVFLFSKGNSTIYVKWFPSISI